jgi:4'-phosphopantetheinyl transferase EntD
MLTPTRDRELDLSLGKVALQGITVGHRIISPGDEDSLLPQEAEGFQRSLVQVRRASGAARMVARALLQQFGHETAPLPKSPGGPPIWPGGLLGSLAHDCRIAIAAIAAPSMLTGLGIDIEPAADLNSDLLDFITTPCERAAIHSDPHRGLSFFVAKEAVYKAVFPRDRRFLEHKDIEVDLVKQTAQVCNGRVVNIRICSSTHLVALAFF